MLHVARGKCGFRAYVQNAGDGEMTPPRSLGRCAPAVRLRRALPAHKWLDKETKRKSIRKGGKRMRRCRFSIGSAPLTSITKSDAQISGGETRQDLKIPGVSPRWLPLALSCSRPAVYVLWWKPYLNHHVPLRLDSSLQAGLYARTPRSARLPRPFR